MRATMTLGPALTWLVLGMWAARRVMFRLEGGR